MAAPEDFGEDTLASTSENVVKIVEELLPAQNQSHFLGLKLGLPLHDVKGIQSNYHDPRDRLLQVIIEFLNQEQTGPTWRVIVDALRSPLVNLPALAKRVEAAHCPDTTSTRDIEAMQVRDKEPQQRLGEKRSCETLVETQLQSKKPRTEITKVVTLQTENKENQSLVPRPSPHETTKFFMNISLLDPQFDFDFTYRRDGKTKYYRGGERYYRPCGWRRFALKVKGIRKYEDDKWLGEPGPRQHSSEGEWPVCYYGTRVKMFQTIAQKGYCGLREVNSLQEGNSPRGICCSPFINVAARYAETFSYEGRTYQLVFQNRVSDERLNKSFWYWTQPHGENVRPYGFCVRPVDP